MRIEKSPYSWLLRKVKTEVQNLFSKSKIEFQITTEEQLVEEEKHTKGENLNKEQ
jgi:hypothetical protein